MFSRAKGNVAKASDAEASHDDFFSLFLSLLALLHKSKWFLLFSSLDSFTAWFASSKCRDRKFGRRKREKDESKSTDEQADLYTDCLNPSYTLQLTLAG